MMEYPRLDPVILQLGALKIHWYGVMYLVGFVMAYRLGRVRTRRHDSPLRGEQLSDAIFYAAMGVVLGGRLGYVLFYHTAWFWQQPLAVFKIWQGGMSFHGGMLGVMAAMWLFARLHGISWLALMDFAAPLVPIGLGAGRLGNFINGELWGRVTDVSWGMVFANAGPLARHPSALYEFALEGVLLFVVLWCYSAKRRPVPSVSSLFLVVYGAMRFGVEFFRQPDAHIGYVWDGWMTMGQLLSVPMVLLGLILFVWSYKRN